MLDHKLNDLKKKIIKYASLVREMTEKSFSGLIDKNDRNAKEVIGPLEHTVNEQETVLDEECINLIALYQPEAKQLRIVMMISKMVNDLERMGDKAVNIAESVLYLYDKPPVKPYIDLPRMLDITVSMLDDSIAAFVNEDIDLAMKVLERDDEVDLLRDQNLRDLITFMISDPSTIERSLHLLRIARNLEKIADLTSNICEEVIYIKEGRNVKHHMEDHRE
jgi:phosphate transport system protein